MSDNDESAGLPVTAGNPKRQVVPMVDNRA